MSPKVRKVVLEILKYAVGAVLGAFGFTVTGCASVPIFFI